MPKKSLVDTAYDVLTKRYAEMGKKFTPIPFSDLTLAVGEELGYESDEELLKIASRFYTELTLDGRFVIKGNNTWVLREHELYANVHIDMNEVYPLDEYQPDEDEKKKSDGEGDEDEDEIDNGIDNEEKEEELGEESESELVSGSDEEYDENN